jgi:hypothetical protein
VLFEIARLVGSPVIIAPMKFGNFEFEHVCDIESLRGAPMAPSTQFMPQNRYQNPRNLRLNRYGTGPFCKFKIPRRFQVSGVCVLTAEQELRYVGECASLSARFNAGYGNITPKNCFRGGQETNCRVNDLLYTAIPVGQRIALSFFQRVDYKSVEAALRSTLDPPWNRV